jgi:branched-chain amino acid transport system permease protein
MVSTFSAVLLPSISNMIIYISMILVLLVKPQGLCAK